MGTMSVSFSNLSFSIFAGSEVLVADHCTWSWRIVDFSSSLVPSRRRKHRSQYPPGPILPDTDEYSILPRGYSIPGPSRLDGEDNAAHETPLMRLRRLRYEMEELEAQIEQEKEKSEALDERRGQEGNEDGQQGDAEKEGDESLTGVNGTSKAKGKGKGKKRVEPSPAQLLVQLQSLRGDLTRLSTNADGLNDLANDPSLKEALKRQDRDARARLDKLKHFSGASVEGVDDGPQAATTKPRVGSEGERTPGRLDERLSALEKFLGANEADVDEVRVRLQFEGPKYLLTFSPLHRRHIPSRHPLYQRLRN